MSVVKLMLYSCITSISILSCLNIPNNLITSNDGAFYFPQFFRCDLFDYAKAQKRIQNANVYNNNDTIGKMNDWLLPCGGHYDCLFTYTAKFTPTFLFSIVNCNEYFECVKLSSGKIVIISYKSNSQRLHRPENRFEHNLELDLMQS